MIRDNARFLPPFAGSLIVGTVPQRLYVWTLAGHTLLLPLRNSDSPKSPISNSAGTPGEGTFAVGIRSLEHIAPSAFSHDIIGVVSLPMSFTNAVRTPLPKSRSRCLVLLKWFSKLISNTQLRSSSVATDSPEPPPRNSVQTALDPPVFSHPAESPLLIW